MNDAPETMCEAARITIDAPGIIVDAADIVADRRRFTRDRRGIIDHLRSMASAGRPFDEAGQVSSGASKIVGITDLGRLENVTVINRTLHKVSLCAPGNHDAHLGKPFLLDELAGQ